MSMQNGKELNLNTLTDFLGGFIDEEMPQTKPVPVLYHYHPERFRAYRKYHSYVSDYYKKNVPSDTGLLTSEGGNYVTDKIIDELENRISVFPREKVKGYPMPTLAVEAEATLSTSFARFEQAGRQIFDFRTELITLFSHTDVNEIPLKSIKLPYRSQYLYFGLQDELEFEAGWFFDGAYVESRGQDGEIQFTLTAVPEDRKLSKIWFLQPEVFFTQGFVGSTYRESYLEDAIDASFADLIQLLQERQYNGPKLPFSKEMAKQNIAHHKEMENSARRRYPVYKAALKLVVNALCYLTAYPVDVEERWPDGTPENMLKNTQKGTPKEQARAKSKLATLGYLPVKFCGKNLTLKKLPVVQDGDTLGKKVSVHWRRGHWRNQPYGTGRTLRKLIWLMPVLVGNTNSQTPENGHIYKVEN